MLATALLMCCVAPGRAQINVTFPDPNLEAALRSALGIPTAPLTSDNLRTLTTFYAEWRQITNLSGLEYATNLTTLSLPDNALSDVSPLAGLGNLLYLNLQGNHVGDAHSLASLSQLQSLNLSVNSVQDPAPLLVLTNLTSLNIGYNPLANCPVLAGLVNLIQLSLNRLSIHDPSFLNGLTNLNSLSVALNQIDVMPPLPALQNLTSLDLRYNPLTNAAALAGLTNLDTLSLDYCPLAKLGFFSDLTRLKYLYLEYANLSDVSTLASLTNLGVLMVSGDPLTNAAALGGLTNLTTLYAASCSLTNMDFVGSLTRLQALDLHANRIADLPPMSGLAYLEYLNLAQNRLTNISGLQDLPAPQTVLLEQNLLDLSAGSPALTVISNLWARGVFVSYQPQNQPPVIEIPATWAVPMDRTSSLQFYVSDDVTPYSQLAVTVVSGDTNLVPNAGLALQHYPDDITWTLTVTPQTGQTGTTTLTVTATDDTGFTATTNLPLTVFYAPPVVFPDTNLEAVVRNTLGLLTGPLTTDDLQTLTYLTASYLSISNLTGLEWATNLTTLDVSGNPITNFSPLLALTQLLNLNVGYNNLRDLSPLSLLTNLTTLTLDGNPSPNLAQLASLPNLAQLSVGSCSLSNLTGIDVLAHLQSLSLGYNGLRDVSPLAALTNLVYLDLQGNPLAGTAGLAGLSKLQTLMLTQCSLNSLNDLHGLTNLQYLYLAYNAIRDLSPLAGLTNLVYLALDSNPITSVAALAALPRLTALTLINCSLSNLVSAQGLTALQTLSLANNGIRDLTPLAALTNLITLYLGGNSPTNLAPLDGLPKLSNLDLTSCLLSNVSSLVPMTQLRYLNLAYDRLTDVSALLGLTNLYSLYLSANRLTNITGLQNLSGLYGVDLTRNLLDLSVGLSALTTITSLQTQGAWVNYEPQNQPPTFYGLRTNWTIRPNSPADLQFALSDDVTLADQVTVTLACASAGPLSNSATALVRTSFVLSSGSPAPPILLPPIVIHPSPPLLPPVRLPPLAPDSGLLAARASLAFPILISGGGVSYWDLTVTPTLNQTGMMTLTLTATDNTGISTNATIFVTVTPPQGLDGVFLGATNLVWQTGGNAPWFGQTNASQTGSFAAQSGPVGVGEESWLGTTVTGPGILTFWWKRTTVGYGSQVSFSTSRGGELSLQGTTGWRLERVSIPAGDCVLAWSYTGSYLVATADALWLDQVSFVPTTPDFWVELASGPDSSGAAVTLHGEPGGLYELQVSTNLVDWSPLGRVVLDPVNAGFSTAVTDPSAHVGVRFYRARQLPAGTTWFAPLTFDAASSPVLHLCSRPGGACEIQASTDLLTWFPLATVTNMTGMVTFTDTQTGPTNRFYQARQLP